MKLSTRINICLLCKLFWGNSKENQPQSLLCIIVLRAIRRLLYFLWAKAAFHSFLFCLWKDQSHWFRLLNKISTHPVWTGSIILTSFHRFPWWQKVYSRVLKLWVQCSPVIQLKGGIWWWPFYTQHFQILNDFRRKGYLCFRLRLLVSKLFFMLWGRHIFTSMFNSLILSIL